MKTKIMTVLLIMTAVGLKAQEYIPLVAEGKQWNVLFSYPWYPPDPQHKYTDIYKMEGDTLLGGVEYKKLYRTRDEHLTDWQFCRALREEDRKVYMYERGDDRMLYDFSMQVGDTICVYDDGNGHQYCMVVSEIGETLVGDEPRQEIVLEYPFVGVTETWIEGIGSLYGIINTGAQFLTGGITDLLCYYEDNDLIWQNSTPGFDRCYIINPDGIDENEEELSVSVYPNPAKNTFTIMGKNLKAEILTLRGQNVATAIGEGETLQIDLANLPAGVYFVNITDSEGRKCVRKVVKE